MKYVSIDSERAEVIEQETGIQFKYIDGSIKGIQIPIGDSYIKIEIDSYSVKVVEPAPLPKQIRYKLIGTVMGLPVEKTFEMEHQALREKHEFERKASDQDDVKLEVQEIEVTINRDGTHASERVIEESEIPF